MLLRKTLFSIVIFSLLLSFFAQAQTAHKNMRKGDEAYLKGDYQQAESHYRAADATTSLPNLSTYNLGNALYQQGKIDEALIQYERATKNYKSNEIISKAHYNQGNIFFEKKEYAKSIEAYKQALRSAPSDIEAKKNLVLAQRELKKQKQQEQEQKQPKNQEQESDKKPDKKPDKKSDKQSDKVDNQKEPQPQGNDSQDMMMKIIAEEDKKTQRRVQERQIKPHKPNAKDW